MGIDMVRSWRYFLIWRVKNIDNKYFTTIVAGIIGIAVGLCACFIRELAHYISASIEALMAHYTQVKEYAILLLMLILPFMGIFFVILFRRLLGKNIGHGIPTVLYAISKKRGRIESHNMFSSIVGSSLTVGFGGSVGLEGPTVATGAAYGSFFSRTFSLNYSQTILMLGCACAGAMAAIFQAPIAGVVFAIEVIMIDLTLSSLLPIMTASIMSYLVSSFLLGAKTLYPVNFSDQFDNTQLIFFVLLGIIAGLTSSYFIYIYQKLGAYFRRLNLKPFAKLAVAGISLGILILLFPPLFGEGYVDTNERLNGQVESLFTFSLYDIYQGETWVVMLLLLALIFIKPIATALTFEAGGIGGVFAPSLFIGAHIGMLFAYSLNTFFDTSLNVGFYAFIGMAGVISGVIHAPLTAMFMIAEITGGYSLLFPLMISGAVSFITVRVFYENNIYSIQLARRGELMTHHKDKAALGQLNISSLIETNFVPLKISDNLSEVVKAISKSNRNVFPVLDNEGVFLGIVRLDDIRDIIFKPEQYEKVKVSSLLNTPSVVIEVSDTGESVAEKLHRSGYYNIPVVENKKYLGFVSRANVFSEYRRVLKSISEH